MYNVHNTKPKDLPTVRRLVIAIVACNREKLVLARVCGGIDIVMDSSYREAFGMYFMTAAKVLKSICGHGQYCGAEQGDVGRVLIVS